MGVLMFVPMAADAEFFWNRNKDQAEPAGGPPPQVVVPTVPTGSDVPPVSTPPAAATAAPTAPSEKRALYRLKDQETVDALVKLAAGRKLREQELAVVARLLNEKQMELRGFNQQLQETFGISEEGNYQYDNESRTLFEVKAKPGAENAPVDAKPEDWIEKTKIKKLRADAEETFLKMVGAKKITTDEIRSLQLIIQEKKIELTNILESLQQQFSMSADNHYEYDAESRVVYQLEYPKSDGALAATKAPEAKAKN